MKINTLILSFSMAFSVLTLFQMPGFADEDFPETPKITVRGEASIYKPADQMEVTLGVVTMSDTAAKATNENNEKIQQVLKRIGEVGLEGSDFQTGHYTVQPVYQKNNQETYGVNQEGKIIGYKVVNAIRIKTSKVNLADKIVEAAVKGGANQIDQLNFNLVNPQSYREEAIRLAAKNALADASALADAAGVKIKRVLSLTTDIWQQFPATSLSKQLHAQVESGQASSLPEFKPGKGEIHANVGVVLEIAPQS